MADLPIPRLTIRGSDGVYSLRSPPTMEPEPALPKDPASGCKVMKYSSDGSHFAWNNGRQVNVVKTTDGEGLKPKAQIQRPRTLQMVFSPGSTQLATWEIYTTKKGSVNAQGEGAANVCIWSLATGEMVQSWIHRSPEGWEPQWTSDDAFLLRGVTNQVHFYDSADFTKGVVKKCVAKGMQYFKVSPGPGPCAIATFIPGSKGGPAAVRLYVDPLLDKPAASKNFFKAEKIDITWNKQGTACLVRTATETDATGKSYYGETNLYYMGVKSGESIHVQLDKDGPLYDYDWNPNGEEFAVVYGFMPAKVMLFDRRCNKIRDFGTGARSAVRFSPHGNILLFGGFGNLASGEMQFWSRKDFTLINQLNARDTTMFEWCPDGVHVMTATHAPRLKVDNGFLIWNYGKPNPVFKSDLKELTGLMWQPAAPGVFPELPVMNVVKKFGGQPAHFVAKKETAYRPPGARGTESTIKLHTTDLGDAAKDTQNQLDTPLTKAALKNKKKREAKAKAAKQTAFTSTGVASKAKSDEMKAAIAAVVANTGAPAAKPTVQPTSEEFEKKIRNLNKKLRQIDALVEKKVGGAALQVNQQEKIKDRPAVEAEIAELTAKMNAL